MDLQDIDYNRQKERERFHNETKHFQVCELKLKFETLESAAPALLLFKFRGSLFTEFGATSLVSSPTVFANTTADFLHVLTWNITSYGL